MPRSSFVRCPCRSERFGFRGDHRYTCLMEDCTFKSIETYKSHQISKCKTLLLNVLSVMRVKWTHGCYLKASIRAVISPSMTKMRRFNRWQLNACKLIICTSILQSTHLYTHEKLSKYGCTLTRVHFKAHSPPNTSTHVHKKTPEKTKTGPEMRCNSALTTLLCKSVLHFFLNSIVPSKKLKMRARERENLQ